MSIAIYTTGGTLIPEEYIYEIKRSYNLFGENFRLGCTPAQQVELLIDKDAISNESEFIGGIEIYENGVLSATLLICDNIEENDKTTLRVTFTDAMVAFEYPYDASQIMGDDPVTLLDIAEDICAGVGIPLATTDFYGYDKEINWYNNQFTARDYLGFIAELNGGYAYIEADGSLVFREFTPNPLIIQTINVNDCENFTVGEGFTIARVLYDDQAGTYWEYGSGEGNTYYIDLNNPYITEEADVEAIYNKIHGLTFNSVTVDNCPQITSAIGSLIRFNAGGGQYYYCFAQFDDEYAGDGWYGGYNFEINSPAQQETQVIGAEQKIRTMKTTIDRINNKFTREIAETVASFTYRYGYGTSSTTHPADSAFTYTSMPAIQSGKYIWRRTTETTVGGTSTNTYEMIQGATGQPGTSGVSVTEAIPLYYMTTSTTVPAAPTSAVTTGTDNPNTWSTTKPAYLAEYMYYTCMQVKYSNNTYAWGNVSEESQLNGINDDLLDLNSRVQDTQSSLEQTASDIRASVTQVTTDLGTVAGSLTEYAKTTEVSSMIEQSATSVTASFRTQVNTAIDGVDAINETLETYFDFSAAGMVIGKTGNPVRTKLDEDSLDFIDGNDAVIAQFDANNGLTTSQISIGEIGSTANQWQIIPWQSGSHLRFTRHT